MTERMVPESELLAARERIAELERIIDTLYPLATVGALAREVAQDKSLTEDQLRGVLLIREAKVKPKHVAWALVEANRTFHSDTGRR